MNLQNRLILFFFVTSLGSALSSIASFLSIENYFRSLFFLGLALSVRTFASATFSYISNSIIHKFGLRKCLLLSQIFGCLALLVLYAGFHFNNFSLTLLGIMLTGLPSTFASILLTILLRVSSQDSANFRKYSGKRELVFGVAMLAASIMTPILLYKFSINTVLLIDVVSYIFGILLIINLSFNEQAQLDSSETAGLGRLIFTSQPISTFMLKTSAALILAGLLPLLAASGSISFTADMPILLRQWLWSIEDITAISASLMYLIFTILRAQTWFEELLMLSGIWLIVPLLYLSNVSVVISAIIICLLTDFSGQKFRDDLIISAGDNQKLIKAYSAISQFQRNFIFFLSPIILTILFTFTNIITTVIALICIQLFFYIGYKVKLNRYFFPGNENI